MLRDVWSCNTWNFTRTNNVISSQTYIGKYDARAVWWSPNLISRMLKCSLCVSYRNAVKVGKQQGYDMSY
jgi:hypothetical protein